MKFQNPTIHRSKVNGRTHTQTDRQLKSNMPFQLFQSWGHKKKNILSCSSFQPLAPPPGMDPGVGCHVIKAKLTVHQWPKYECFLIYSYQDMN